MMQDGEIGWGNARGLRTDESLADALRANENVITLCMSDGGAAAVYVGDELFTVYKEGGVYRFDELCHRVLGVVTVDTDDWFRRDELPPRNQYVAVSLDLVRERADNRRSTAERIAELRAEADRLEQSQ